MKADKQVVDSIRQLTGCSTAGKVYDCLNELSTEEINGLIISDPFNPPWRPVFDDDFFPENFDKNPTFALSKRSAIK